MSWLSLLSAVTMIFELYVFKLLHYCSINLSCCITIKICEYFILTPKEIVKPGQLWKIWKETAYIELCSFFIDILAFELGKLCPRWGFCVPFSTQGPEFCTEKLSPGWRIWRKKLVALGLARGGMVTGQINTCISFKGITKWESPYFENFRKSSEIWGSFHREWRHIWQVIIFKY